MVYIFMRDVMWCDVVWRRVVAIGKELPYTLNALKRNLQLQFPILSDPKLQAYVI